MSIYQRLERLGWQHVGGNSRFDVYAKKNWRLTISKHIGLHSYAIFTRSKVK